MEGKWINLQPNNSLTEKDKDQNDDTVLDFFFFFLKQISFSVHIQHTINVSIKDKIWCHIIHTSLYIYGIYMFIHMYICKDLTSKL